MAEAIQSGQRRTWANLVSCGLARWLMFSPIVVRAFVITAWAMSGHNALLPQPQQINYGTHQLRVRGMGIRLVGEPAIEDRFAAEQLSACLSDIAKEAVLISMGESSERVIVLKRTGEVSPLPLPGEQPGPESRESYMLKVTPDGGSVQAKSSAGLFYAVQTLCQLAEGSAADASLPEVDIHDWPSLAYRGTMVDISHGPLPKEDEIERQLDFLARWKSNQYYLYSEDSIELRGYPLLNPDGRLTQDEVRRIVAYGRQRHIDVIPNLDLYAHQHDLFRIEKYSALSDQPHGTEFDPNNPKVAPLLTDWANQLADLFPSPFVHIGLDETFQIERATRASGTGASPTALFVKQLALATRLFQERGKHVIAFGDIMVKYPQMIPDLPPGLIAAAWYYTSEDPTYKHWLAPLAASHVPHIVEPGVMSYDNIAPDFNTTFENIDTFLAAGRRSGALGLVNTVWADDGQVLFRMSLPAMAYGAAAPWQSGPMDRAHFFADYAHVMFPATIAPDIATALSDMSASETELQKVLGDEFTQFALWRDPFVPAYLKDALQDQGHLRETRLLAEDAETRLYQALASGANPTTLNSLLVGARLLDYAGQKFQTPPALIELWRQIGTTHPDAERWWNEWESQAVHQDHSRLVDLMDAITELRPLYRAEWLDEYSPYRLDSALGRWDAEYEYWRKVQQRLQQFSDSSHEGDILPPLEKLAEER